LVYRDEHKGDGVHDTERIETSGEIHWKRFDAAFQYGDQILREVCAEEERDEDGLAKQGGGSTDGTEKWQDRVNIEPSAKHRGGCFVSSSQALSAIFWPASPPKLTQLQSIEKYVRYDGNKALKGTCSTREAGRITTVGSGVPLPCVHTVYQTIGAIAFAVFHPLSEDGHVLARPIGGNESG
jgi:hypothetical protein